MEKALPLRVQKGNAAQQEGEQSFTAHLTASGAIVELSLPKYFL